MTIQRISIFVASFFMLAIQISPVFAQTTSEDPFLLLKEADRLAWLKNWTKAEPLFVRAERLFAQRGDQRNELYARAGRLRGQLPRLAIQDVSNQLSDLLGNAAVQNDEQLRLRVLTVKGDTDMDLDSNLALRDWSETMELAKRVGDKQWEARANGEIGIIDFLHGDSAAAMIKISSAITSAQRSGDIGAQIRYLTLAGSGVAEFGNVDTGLGLLDTALRLAEANPETATPVMTYTAKAGALDRAGRTTEANQLLERALQAAREVGSLGYQAELLIQMALLSKKAGNSKLAVQQLQQANNLAEQTDGPRPAALAKLELSKLYLANGDLVSAETVSSSGVNATRRVGDRFNLPRHLSQLANVKTARRQYAEAAAVYEEATDILNGLLLHTPSPESKASLIGVMDEVYLGHFRLAASALNDWRRAFTIVEQARGRSLADLIAVRPTGSALQPAKLTQVEKQISALQIQLLNMPNRNQRKRVLDELVMTEWSVGPILASTTQSWMRIPVEPITLQRLQSILNPDEAFLEFVLDDPVSYCLVVTRESAGLRRLGRGSIISQRVEELLSSIRDNKDPKDVARAVYAELLGPIPEISRKNSLIVVPDGVLHQLPIELLINSAGQRLLETHIVTYVQSGTVLALLRRAAGTSANRNPLLAVSASPENEPRRNDVPAVQRGIFDLDGVQLPPLPAASDEVRAVAQALGPESITLFGDRANEGAIKSQRLGQYKVLHFAVHGLLSTKFPERSALVLPPDPTHGEDGLLQAREITQLSLNADLVTLSACETGNGKIRGQEGVATLVRPFLVAGARSVVANVWQADDEFALALMKGFYARLASGETKAAALRDAKLELIRKFGPQATPALWAGFIIVGDGSNPIVPKIARKVNGSE